ncbi:MAG TPA: hypothetical protein VFN35_14025, partial [Ktedonobacteraceae bacterium]|nr:hypothetical protein [Ktedonobacteraceae bacterium]
LSPLTPRSSSNPDRSATRRTNSSPGVGFDDLLQMSQKIRLCYLGIYIVPVPLKAGPALLLCLH